MLWRVRQGFRHLRQAKSIVQFSPCYSPGSLFLIVQPLHISFTPRWPPAVAYHPQTLSDSRCVREERSQKGQAPGQAEDIGRVQNVKHGRGPKSASQTSSPFVGRSKDVSSPAEPPFTPVVDMLFRRLALKHRLFQVSIDSGELAQLAEYVGDRTRAGELAMLMADSSVPMRALQVCILAHKLGCTLKQSVYEGLAYRFASKHLWVLVRSTVELGKGQTGRTTIRLLNWRVRALIETNEYASLDNVIEQVKKENLLPNRRTYHLLVSGYLRNRDLLRAQCCLASMERAGFPMDVTTHALIVSSYRSLGPDPAVKAKALEVLREADPRSSTLILNGLIQLALDANNMPEAFQYLSMYDRHPTEAEGLVGRASDITQQGGDLSMTKLGSNGSSPPPSCFPAAQDAMTFTMLINHLAKEADLDRILQVLQRMQSAGISPDGSTAAALVRAYFISRKPDVAVQIVANMCSSSEEVRGLFRRIGLPAQEVQTPLPEGIPPTTELFNALLRGVSNIYGLNGIRTVQRIMRCSHIRADGKTIAVLLQHLVHTQRSLPREVIRTARAFNSRGATITLEHMHVVLSSVLHREQEILRYNRRPSIQSGSSGRPQEISGVGESFDPIAGVKLPPTQSYTSLTRPLLAALSSRRIRSDKATFALRIKHDAVIKGDLDLAKHTFEAMVSRGLHPNEYHFAALMEGYAALGDMDGAVNIMRSASKFSSHSLNVKMYTILINGYGSQGKPSDAIRTFREMVNAGIQPDATAVYVLAKAFVAARAYQMARRVVLQLWPSALPFPEHMREASLHRLMHQLNLAYGKAPSRRLSARKQRMLRWKINRIMKGWDILSAHTGRLERSKSRTGRT
ncbi:uncharacterized protein FIBRA_00996 [Fibroporia radiculosa]|uniref:Pentacotripeptide-repeat region of PRORP domain-containing protein n=1 Tax=Fibroporia radiculosa TaxID=599839 RepID=J4G0Q8_9APHY|nr:uncharacterized protein FIBRA_00996 [Fibroporia radiculosa]CCL98988.1 predicted protein [Fibroporia radiculosa]